jgi:NAD+ synthase
VTVATPGLAIQADLVTALLVDFLREEVGRAGFSRTLLGLSGGIDSAVAAALAARAFGADNVLGVLLPYRTSSPDSAAHALRVAESIGIPTRTIDITAMADGYLTSVDIDPRTVRAGGTEALRRGNVLARCRMIALYDLSVVWNGLVVGTSNKTEMLLGYSTQWGDAAHAVNPLGDLYKAQVYALARHLDLPREVIDKAPSADLFEGQTDEADLGFSYAEADAILYRMVDERYGEAELVREGFDAALVRRVARRVIRNQFKRLPPVIAKIGHRSINHDFRYLRDWGI